MKDKRALIVTIVITAALACVPFVINTETSYFVYFLFLSFTYIIITQGWNVVAGYTGQISLGQHAFFGLGAYTTAMNWIYDITKTGYYFDPVTMLLSGIVPAIVAIAIGIPLLSKLRGDYLHWGLWGWERLSGCISLRGGPTRAGRSGCLSIERLYLHEALLLDRPLLALFATAVVYFLTRSRIGLALTAIREDETAAAATGSIS